MMANPLLILHRKIKEKFVLTAPIFDATGNRTAGGVGCFMQHQNLILILIQETTVL
jgi:hypothetical protein